MNKTFNRRAVLRAGGLTAGALTLGVGMPAWAADRIDAFVSKYQGKDMQLGMMAGTSPSFGR